MTAPLRRVRAEHWVGGVATLGTAAALAVALLPGGSGSPPAEVGPAVPGSVSVRHGDIRVQSAYLPQPATPSVAAVYLTVRNDGGSPDTLLGATSDVSSAVGLHDEATRGGLSTMVAIDELPVAAHGSVVLEPGHRHLMIEDPTRPLRVGGTVRITLSFERAGPVAVDVPVLPVDAGR